MSAPMDPRRHRAPQPDLLDRRQRVAAAILLHAVDLPQEMSAYAQLSLTAAKVCPGLNVSEAFTGQPRRVMLERARELIDEMLAEGS